MREKGAAMGLNSIARFWTLFFSKDIIYYVRKQMVVCYEYIFQLYVKMETLLSLETDATRVPWVLKLTSQTASL